MMRYGLSCGALLVLMPLPVVCKKEIDRGKDSEGASALKTFVSRGFIETSDESRCSISIKTPAAIERTAYRFTSK